jgi:hypothetical protein
MPPTMMIGISSAGPASLVANQICGRVERSWPLSQPLLRPYQMQTTISAIAITIAGTTPAIDSWRIDTPEMKAYTRKGIDSGIKSASVPATDSNAAAKPRE